MKDPKTRLHTLSSSPPSPTSSSSSSSDFEFIISLSPTSRKSSLLCPADELFYKGQLLPLHLSPRLSMVRTLLASSSTSSSSDTTTTTTTTTSRDSNSSSSSSYSCDLSLLAELDSARPSSVTDLDDEFKKPISIPSKKSKYFSLSRFSSVFLRKSENSTSNSSKRIATSAKEVLKKYVKKVKPLYEKFTPKQSRMASADRPFTPPRTNVLGCNEIRYGGGSEHCKQSFSGNLRCPRRRSCVVSCPSSMRSSPTHSGVLQRGVVGGIYSNSSSMEELQSAIEGAIKHCKNSMSDFNEKKEGIIGEALDGE